MKILVVYKKSAYERYLESGNKSVQDFLRSEHHDVLSLKKIKEKEEHSLQKVVRILKELKLDYELVLREDLKKIKSKDLVITVGGDGTFLDVSHFVDDKTLMLGVNSNPEQSTGFFCAATTENLKEILTKINQFPQTTLNRLKIIRNGQEIPINVLNDILLANSNPAATTIYRLGTNGFKEFKSSGLLISTAAGSSGWIYQEEGKIMPLDSEQLQYLPLGIRGAKAEWADQIMVNSLTKEGKIFLDGPHLQYPFEFGDQVVVEKGLPLTVMGDLAERRNRLVKFK